MRGFIKGVLVVSAVLIIGTIKVYLASETGIHEKLLVLFNFIFVIIVTCFCFLINKEYKYIRTLVKKASKSKNIDEVDVIYNIKNKSKFIKDAELAILNQKDKKYAVVHYDINKFTIINNTVGYKIGDDIMQEIGKVLRQNLKKELIGKAEGDNFFVLFEYTKEEELINRACFISSKIEEISIWESININPIVKAGIYFVDNSNVDIRIAIDRACFAKSSLSNIYKSSCTVYEDKISRNLIEVKKIEDCMDKALLEHQFKIYLQPKVNLKTGIISGAEALVRWEHPELGLLYPSSFIPLFEKNGFIIKLDKYVFEQVCIHLRRWIDLEYEVVPISVNVSRVHFINTNFVSEYNKIKQKYSISHNLIEIEITESVVFSNENESEIFNVMRKFREDGFEISMDDFGSGYSSLGLLKEMPIDTLKLDRLFLKNIEDYNSQIIVSNIVNMAKNLNLNVVSEGVETSMQVDFLRDIGCDMAQGFIFSKPEPINIYEKLISKGKKNYYEIAG